MNTTSTNQVKTSPDKQISVLLIEHDPELRKVMKISLEQNGLEVMAVERFANAMNILKQGNPNLFLVDFDLVDGDPGKLIDIFRQKTNNQGAVLVTTTCRPDDHWRRTYQPDAVVYKPFDVRHLYRKILTLDLD